MSIIKTDRLTLRTINRTDLDLIFIGLSNPEVIKYYGVSYESKEAAIDQLKWYAELERNGTGKWWAICNNDRQEFLGAIGLNDIIADHQKGEVGFWLLPKYWGNGYVSEALPFVLDYGFREMKLHRIEGIVESGNSNSSQVLLRHGFTHEGTLKDSEIKNGNFISLEIYSLLAE